MSENLSESLHLTVYEKEKVDNNRVHPPVSTL